MASVAFLREIQTQFVKPRFKFVYYNNGYSTDYTHEVISISPIQRSDNLSAQYVSVELENTVDTWSAFRTNHAELTKKAIISLCIGNPISFTKSMAYHEGGANPDTITDASNSFLTTGLIAGTVIIISGTANNNKSVMITGVTAGTLTIDTSDDLTEEGAVNSTLTTEAYSLFTGAVESATISMDQATCTLKIRDKLSLLLENKVGGYSAGQFIDVNVNYWGDMDPVTKQGINRSSAYYASQLVWIMLTSYGKLDATASTANTDIDYTSYLAWKASVDNNSYILYDIGCVIGGGPSVASIVSAIAKLTVSQVWGGGNGKIKFKGSMQSIPGVWDSYTKANALSAALDISIDGRKNLYYTKYGYIPSVDIWGSDQNGVSNKQELHGPSAEPYLYQTQWEQDRQVYHNGIASADLYATEWLTITAPPIRTWTLELPLFGFLEDVGNEIILSNFYATPPYNSMEVHLQEVSFDPMNFKATLKGYYIWGAGELA